MYQNGIHEIPVLLVNLSHNVTSTLTFLSVSMAMMLEYSCGECDICWLCRSVRDNEGEMVNAWHGRTRRVKRRKPVTAALVARVWTDGGSARRLTGNQCRHMQAHACSVRVHTRAHTKQAAHACTHTPASPNVQLNYLVTVTVSLRLKYALSNIFMGGWKWLRWKLCFLLSHSTGPT